MLGEFRNMHTIADKIVFKVIVHHAEMNLVNFFLLVRYQALLNEMQANELVQDYIRKTQEWQKGSFEVYIFSLKQIFDKIQRKIKENDSIHTARQNVITVMLLYFLFHNKHCCFVSIF